MSRLAPLLAAAVLVSAALQDEMVENPEYKAWAKLKPGAWVKWSLETNMGAMKMQQVMTQKLKEVTAEKVVVDQIITIDLGGKPQDQVTPRAIPAKIAKGTNSDGAKVEEIGKGEEELEAKGAKYKCPWVELKLLGKQGGTVKIWRNDQVVGGALKTVIKHDEAAKMTMTMTVVDWKDKD